MAKFAKQTRRRMRQRVRSWRQAVAATSPRWAHRAFGPLVHYTDMLLVDHGIFRLAYLNRHRLGRRAWRSAQPAPHQVAALQRLGIKTVINLRGPRHCGSYWLEQYACARHGIRLVDFQIRSRAAPSREEVLGARQLFQQIDYPVLMHCKSGADRAGLMSALYLICCERRPAEEARRQLALKFGHIRQSDTGILDHFFDRYVDENARGPIDFFEWIEQRYDPDELKRSFAAKGWANVLINKVLRRE